MIKKHIFGFICLFFFAANQVAAQNQLPKNNICADETSISGQIMGFANPNKLLLVFSTQDVLLGEKSYQATIYPDGKFNVCLPLCFKYQLFGYHIMADDVDQTKYGYGDYGYGLFMVDQNSPVKINFMFDKDSCYSVVKGNRIFRVEDKINLIQALSFFYENMNFLISKQDFELNMEHFAEKQLDTLCIKRIQETFNAIKLSEAAKEILTISFRSLYVSGPLLTYCQNAEKYGIMKAEPPLSYYRFLKKLNLQSPLWFYDIDLQALLHHLIDVKAFGIKDIGDQPVEVWINDVSKKIKTIIGFSSGNFYDLLAMTAYEKQINKNGIPLSATQKENIRSYFKAEKQDMIKLLLRCDSSIVKSAD